jgi:hypothetical protein
VVAGVKLEVVIMAASVFKGLTTFPSGRRANEKEIQATSKGMNNFFNGYRFFQDLDY